MKAYGYPSKNKTALCGFGCCFKPGFNPHERNRLTIDRTWKRKERRNTKKYIREWIAEAV